VSPQLLRETHGIQPHKTVQKDYINERPSPGPDGVNYARPLKVTKAKKFLKRDSYAYPLIFKLLTKGKLMSLANAFCLSKVNMTFNGI
jgi:hypothetical protein